jgi:hypothetical protein
MWKHKLLDFIVEVTLFNRNNNKIAVIKKLILLVYGRN